MATAERNEELKVETADERAANFKRAVESERKEAGQITPERLTLIRRIMFMNAKDRMKLGMKGDREARGILIRDSNRVVATAVINNPRITEQEVENIASMRTVADEVLRLMRGIATGPVHTQLFITWSVTRARRFPP